MTTTINASTSAGLVNTADTSGILQLQTANTAAVTVDASQNVGIGTTSPASKLSVGSASYSQSPSIGQVNGTNVTTTNSGGLFNIGSTDAAAANIGGSLGFTANGTLNGYPTGQISGRRESATGSNYSSYLAFTTSDSGGTLAERMRIDSSGNVLVGTTTSSAKTYVYNNITQFGIGIEHTTASYAALMVANTASSGTRYLVDFRVSGTAGGNQQGTITSTGTNVAYNTSSDYRLKENIAPMTGALDKVAQLKPVTYTWKIDGSNGQGFIAHELQAVCPQAVTGEKDAVDEEGKPIYQGVDTSFLVATLTAAIQEQQTIINDLKARVTALEAK